MARAVGRAWGSAQGQAHGERRFCSQVPPPQSSVSPGHLARGSMTWATESIRMEKTAAWEEGQQCLIANTLVSSPSLGGFQQC